MLADRPALVASGVACGIDACAIVLAGGTEHAGLWLIAGMLHLAASLVLLVPRGSQPGESSRRLLAATMVITLPVLGPILAALVIAVRGRGGDELLAGHERRRRRMSGAEVAHRVTAGLPACESLMAGAGCRRTTLAALQRAPDTRTTALLRWSVKRGDRDLAVEAALALEQLQARCAERAAHACAEADRRPSRETALAAAAALADPIHSGLTEPALVRALAALARRYYERAASLDEARAGELVWARARLELAVLCPEAALALIAPAVLGHPDEDRLTALYRDAAHAARRFDLLPREVAHDAA